MSHQSFHTHNAEHQTTKHIRSAFFLNLFFTVIEIVGGIFTNSVAILSDALHDLGDSLSLGLSWYFQKVSQKKRDPNYSFGYKRYSVFGAIINAIIIITGSVIILFEAIPRLFSPSVPNAQGMLILSLLGIVFNGIAFLRVKKGNSLNEKVVMLHLLEDVLGWLAVFIASIVMIFTPLPILDPILSLAIAAFVLFNAIKNLNRALKIVMQGTPQAINISDIENKVTAVAGVQSVHDTHLWSMDGSYNVLTLHVVLNNNSDLATLSLLKTKIRHELKSEDIKHITIEFEGLDEECLHIDC